MRVEAIEGHRLWSKSYDTDPNPLLSLEKRVLDEWLGPLNEMRLVDVACGTGRWMSFAQQRGAYVWGVDLCPEMLAIAAEKPDLAGRVALADSGRLPFETGFADLCICSFAVSYFRSVTDALAEMVRVVRRAGRIVVSDLDPDAMRAGWKRSFRWEGDFVEIDFDRASDVQLRKASTELGLILNRHAAVHFGLPERKFFERAGKAGNFEKACGIPAISIYNWTKP